MKTSIPPVLITFALVCFALSPAPNAFGVVPAPDGGYPGFNTAEGTNALKNLTTGIGNAAVGWYSLFSNTDGSYNTGVGAGTLLLNIGNQDTAEGIENTAVGTGALLFNTTGAFNTANGAFALSSNTEGFSQTATGDRALFSNTTGDFNTAVGYQALYSNTDGNANTANGYRGLFSNTIGNGNTSHGFRALLANTTGSGNTAVGASTLLQNTAGSDNIALGTAAGLNVATASNVICIGANVSGQDVSDSCYIGNIFATTTSGGTAVFINSAGKLGTTTSSRRFKEEIKPMAQASEALYALKPVTFRYKKGIDPQGIPQFGLVAEEVEAVNPDLVVCDKEGKVNTVRYEAVNAMLLNEFLKEHQTVQELKSAAVKQEAMITSQQKQIERLAAGLQRVNVQLELNKLAPQTVKNDD